MEQLDLENINTVEQINNVDWSIYCNVNEHPNWINLIKYPVSQDNLTIVCTLSQKDKSNISLFNSMGELFWEVKRAE